MIIPLDGVPRDRRTACLLAAQERARQWLLQKFPGGEYHHKVKDETAAWALERPLSPGDSHTNQTVQVTKGWQFGFQTRLVLEGEDEGGLIFHGESASKIDDVLMRGSIAVGGLGGGGLGVWWGSQQRLDTRLTMVGGIVVGVLLGALAYLILDAATRPLRRGEMTPAAAKLHRIELEGLLREVVDQHRAAPA